MKRKEFIGKLSYCERLNCSCYGNPRYYGVFTNERGEYNMYYIFKTKTTMKDYNRKKWFIDKDSVPEMCINADTVELALSVYRERVNEHGIVSVSDNAIKNKSEMFVDMPGGSVKQVGYVVTGKAEFDKGDYSGWSTQYIDLWVTILTVVDTVF